MRLWIAILLATVCSTATAQIELQLTDTKNGKQAKTTLTNPDSQVQVSAALQRLLSTAEVALPATKPKAEPAKPKTQPATRHITQEEAADNTFHRELIVAARNLVQRNELSRARFFRLRVAMLSPAFRKHCEDLAVIQIEASGESLAGLPVSETGHLERASIDWSQLISFLEKLIPLVLKLLDMFGGA